MADPWRWPGKKKGRNAGPYISLGIILIDKAIHRWGLFKKGHHGPSQFSSSRGDKELVKYISVFVWSGPAPQASPQHGRSGPWSDYDWHNSWEQTFWQEAAYIYIYLYIYICIYLYIHDLDTYVIMCDLYIYICVKYAIIMWYNVYMYFDIYTFL